MVKTPPCDQYNGSHSLMVSKTGLRFCRKARQAGPKKNKPAPVRRAKKPVKRAAVSPNINKININFLHQLTRNIPVARLNRVGKMMYNKSKHNGAYKTKKNMKNEANNAATRGMLPKQTLNQVRASRMEAIRSAQMLRRRLGLSVVNR